MTALQLITSLRGTVEKTLRPLLAGCDRLALIDFPRYSNVGDSAIYLGELGCLRSLGLPPPAYVCDFLTYHRDQLARRLGSGTILLAGGGNFGDLWPVAQRYREEIVSSFPDNSIIQLPQTIRFEDPAALRRARSVIDAHPSFTLLVRDRRSLEIARNEFRARSLLCPDMAFCLGPLARPVAASQDTVWLARTDRESAGPPAARAVDWLTEPWSARRTLTELLSRAARRRPASEMLRDVLTTSYAPLASERLRRGCRLLSSGRAVITDRLHGHILSLLLGLPHVLLDDSYGKLSGFHQTWTAECTLGHWADSPQEALSLALALIEEPREAPA
ncbi:polysaccharide pyruvyl transferase family protein [soil metagenome]